MAETIDPKTLPEQLVELYSRTPTGPDWVLIGRAARAIGRRDWILERWLSAYPADVFIPPTPEQVAAAVAAIQASGITSDALHAAWARHILSSIILEVKERDAGDGQEAFGG